MSVPGNRTSDFIRCLLRRLALALACLLGHLGAASAKHAGNEVLYWIDASGTATLEQAMSPRAPYAPMQEGQIFPGGRTSVVWLHVSLPARAGKPEDWVMEFPAPVLDHVTLYKREADGRWAASTAGDTVAVADWEHPGRYPAFHLESASTKRPMELYVRIRHVTPISLPVRLSTWSEHEQRIQLEYMAMGMALGASLLLIAACLAQARVHRDPAFLWYSAYAALMTLAVAAYTGAAAHLLWPRSPSWADASQAVLSMLAAGAAVLFVRDLAGISTRHRWLEFASLWLGRSALLAVLVYFLLDKSVGTVLASTFLILSVAAALMIAGLSWRRGDAVGMWILLAYLPLGTSVVLVLLRVFGWLPISFATQYAVVIGSVLEVPLLLVALSIRSRERHGAQIREQALSTQDALTGLLAPHLFHDRLRQVVARYRRDQESAAIVFIDLVNYPRIKEFFGSAVAEQSLLRSVIKLRRLLRDVDTVSRIGEARFGVIIEGVTSRIAVTDRAARLIAAGLMPLKGLKPDVTLQFHIAAVLLDQRPMEAPELVESLSSLLASMSPRTRRPIRFIDPVDTQPAPLGGDSSMLDEDSQLPRGGMTRPPADSSIVRH